MVEITIDRAISDRRLLGAALDDLGTWSTWLAVLKAAFGLRLDNEQQKLFASVAGGRASPTRRVRELWCVAGRRAGKTRIAALIAVFIALFVNHRLAPGERGMVLVVAASIDQARVAFGYIKGVLEASPALQKEIEATTRTEITLRNGIVIGVHSSSYRTVRGRSLVGVLCDEVAFWRDETSSAPDVETYRAVLPALATTNGMLVGISTPYRKLGLLHQKHRNHFGQGGDDVLVVQGSSQTFNKTLSDETIAAQREADPTAAVSEWDSLFRSDVSALLDDALIDAAVEHGRPIELPPAGGYVYYRAFTDAAACVGAESYTLAVGHKEPGEGGRFVIDLVRGTSRQRDPQQVTEEYGALLREYRILEVTGDYYAAGWVTNAWQKAGIRYIRSALPKSQIYLEVIPLFARGLVLLPGHQKLLRELRLLERHVHRSGKDSVDHPRNGTDDHANAVCGVLHDLACNPASSYLEFCRRF
jgi:hypothetical protein